MTGRSTRGPWEESEDQAPDFVAGLEGGGRLSGSPPPWILGHRGVPLEAPENTLAGMRRALELGLDGFEYDLRACASGEAVLMHDETLSRTTNSHALLSKAQLGWDNCALPMIVLLWYISAHRDWQRAARSSILTE